MLNVKTNTYRKKLDQNINVWRNAVNLVTENWELSNTTRITGKTFTDWGGLLLVLLCGYPNTSVTDKLKVPPLFFEGILSHNKYYHD